MKQIKCKECGYWNEGNEVACEKCGHVFYEDRHEELKQRQGEGDNIMRLIKIRESDGFWQKSWKHPVRIGQLVFFTIISIIAAIASSTVH